MKLKMKKILSILLVAALCFSVFLIKTNNIEVANASSNYTVDFTYLDKVVNVNGGSKDYELTNVFSSLGIDEEITEIQIYNLDKSIGFENNIVNINKETLFDISKKGDTWVLNSYLPFTDEFIMVASSIQNSYEIKVTDPKTDPRTEPTKDNNYTYSYDELEDGDIVEYQWMHNEGFQDLSSSSDDYFLEKGTISGNTISSQYDEGVGAQAVIFGTKLENCRISFDYTGNSDYIWNCDIISHEGNSYIIRTYAIDTLFYIVNYGSADSFEITNVKLGLEVTIPNQTTGQITLTQDNLGDYDYFCTNKINGVKCAGSSKISPKAICFDADTGTTTLTGPIYQFEGRKVTLPLDSFKKTGYKCVGFTDYISNYTTEYTVQDVNYTLYPIWEKIIAEEPSLENNYTVTIKDSFSENAKYQWNKATEKWAEASTYYCNYSNGRTVDAGDSIYLSQNAYLKADADKVRFKIQGTGSITNCTISSDGYYYPPYNSGTGNFDITGSNELGDTYITNIEVLSYTFTPIQGLTSNTLSSATGSDLYSCLVTLKTGDIAYSKTVKPDKFGTVPTKKEDPKPKAEPVVENKTKIIYSENKDVSFETEEGFSDDITLVVEVISNEIANNDTLLVNTVSLNENEKIGIAFNVKLIKTINGVSTEIQPSDIKEGTVIKVKMLLPNDLDIDNVSRLLHIHSLTDIEELVFDKENIDENGFYSLTVTNLSEFVFIYNDINGTTEPIEKEEKPCIIHWFLLALLILEDIRIILSKKFKRKNELRNLIIYLLALIILMMLSVCSYCTKLLIANAFQFIIYVIIYIIGSIKEKKETK